MVSSQTPMPHSSFFKDRQGTSTRNPDIPKCSSFSPSLNSAWFRSILVTAGGEYSYMAHPRISCARDREISLGVLSLLPQKEGFFPLLAQAKS